MIRDIQAYVDSFQLGDAQKILQDVAGDPALQPFIEPEDTETSTVEENGAQSQVQRLTLAGAKRVVQRIVSMARKTGVDLKEWICGTGKDQFNLCAVLGDLGWTKTMAELDAFLKKKWASWPAAAIGIFAAGLLAKIITALTVLGLVSRELIEMCGCKPDEKTA